jgi:hypothetical protein
MDGPTQSPLRPRLRWAFLCYALIGTAAGFTLDGWWRGLVWLLLAALAFKNWLAVKKDEAG